jgi:hypothetical protein
MRTIAIDSEMSAARYSEFTSYVERKLLRPDRIFCCANAEACRRSIGGRWRLIEGQSSYVGEHYDAADDGRPWRVLVVPMQTGTENRLVDLEERRKQVRGSRDKPFEGSGSRNPHMRGVTKALKVLWGIDPDSGRDKEYLQTNLGRVHLFDTFAMANATLCSRIRLGSKKGQGSKVMLHQCSTHLRETIRILEPTIIHSQGRRKAGSSSHTSVEMVCDGIDWLDEYVAQVRIGEVRAVWVSLKHPSLQWGRNHLRTVVIPALKRARAAAIRD